MLFKRKTCSLCGGRLENNICTECGLDNSKSDDNYVYTPDSRHGGELTHSHGDERDPLAGKTLTREERRRAEAQIRQQKKQEREQQKAREAAARKAQSVRNAQSTGGAWTAAQGQGNPSRGSWNTQTRRRNPRKRLIVIIVVIVLLINFLPLIFTALSELIDGVRYGFDSGQSYSDDYSYYDDGDEDIYAYVQEELDETGESWEETLTPGLYMGGVHIPAGNYTVFLEAGDGTLLLDDSRNSIYQTWFFSASQESDEYTTYTTRQEDVRIYEGARLVISEDVTLRFQTENAQGELTQLPNPNTETYTFSGAFTVGEDLPAGVYDIYCEEGSGIFEYYVPADGYESYQGQLIGDTSSTFPREMKNIVLPDGVDVTIEDMTVTLTPSEYIGSEDYGDYYAD